MYQGKTKNLAHDRRYARMSFGSSLIEEIKIKIKHYKTKQLNK
jgi:hypothetical protein